MTERPRVLVVDDTPENLELATALLRQAGYAVAEARCGEEALRQAERVRPDLILLDVVLPDLSGFEVCRRLKGDPGRGNGLIVLISSAETASERQAAGLESGADGYIARPISNRELVARVEALLRLKRAEDALRASRAEALAHLEAARASEARFRELMESAPDAMLLVDAAGRLALVNRRCLELFGYAAEELIGQPIEALVPEVYREEHVGRRDAFLANPTRAEVGRDLAARRKDGSEFAAAINLSPITGAEGGMVLAAVRDVTGRRRMEQALARRTQHLEAIQYVTGEITRELSLETLLALIVRQAHDLLEQGEAMIRLWDESQQLLLPAAWSDSRPAGSWLPLRLGEGVAGAAAQRREGLIVNDFRESPYATPALLAATTHTAVLAEPLLFRERLIGVLIVNRHPGMAPFGEDDQRLIAMFAAQAAVAIENARLHAAAIRRGEQVDALLKAAQSLLGGLDLETTLDRIVAEAARISGCSQVKILMAEESGGALRARAVRGTTMTHGQELPWGVGLSGRVAQTGEPIFSPEVSQDTRNIFAEQDRAAGLRTFLGLPIRVEGRTLGVLGFNTLEPRGYSEEEIAYLSAFADQAGMAIQNARLHEATERRALQLGTLNHLARSLTTALELPVLAERIMGATQALLPDSVGRLWERTDAAGTLRLIGSIGLRAPEGGQMFQVHPGRGLIGIAMETRQPVISPDVTGDPRFADPAWAKAEGLVSCLVLPLEYGLETMGFLTIFTRRPHVFGEEEMALLRSFGAQAAVAIQNARLYAEAERQRARLKAILDSAVEGFYQTTPEGQFLAANTALARMLGYDSPESLTALVTDIGSQLYVDPERRKEIGRLLTTQGSVKDFEAQLYRRDGGTIWVTINSRAVAESNGAIHHYEGFIQDITERKQAEQLKADFVSFATHQLRTPLAGIKWLLELAGQEADVPAEAGGLIRDAQASTERLIKLVNDLLDVTRMERGKIAVNPEAVDLSAMTAEVLAELEPLVQERGHRLAVEGGLDLPAAWADRQLLRQVVLNLASNAIKYTPAGGAITVRLGAQPAAASPQAAAGQPGEARATSLRPTADPADAQSQIANRRSQMVEFSIQDSGIGIPREALPRLFEKFFRADNVYAVETEGTGLGLYLVRLILEQSGGRVWCESEEGRGSTFTFQVPAGETSQQAAVGSPQPDETRREG